MGPPLVSRRCLAIGAVIIQCLPAIGSCVASENPIDPPLRLEYELGTRAERMTRTTQELRAIVEAMPGRGLPAGRSATSPSAGYADALQETLTRLRHIEQLIVDITRIIEAMPVVGTAPAAAHETSPAVATAARPQQALPVSIPDSAPSGAKTRFVSLLTGGALAIALAVLLRWNFMRGRPSRKELAGTISPPTRDDAIELADIMASMGLAEGAVQALMERIRMDPRQALSHWLKLLDVYRQTGKQAEFENAAREMRTTFNISAGGWRAGGSKASLEDYPHVVAQILRLWSAPSCGDYLLSLLADNRSGKREGFPLPVVEDIVLLLAILSAEK